MREYDKIYNSAETADLKEFQLASGYISTTKIFFEKEQIAAKIEAEGKVEFLDAEDNVIAAADVAEQTGGKGKYTDILCGVEGDAIVLKFPIVEWIDNYPNCDGEHDRWDSRTIGYNEMIFDLNTNKIEVK